MLRDPQVHIAENPKCAAKTPEITLGRKLEHCRTPETRCGYSPNRLRETQNTLPPIHAADAPKTRYWHPDNTWRVPQNTLLVPYKPATATFQIRYGCTPGSLRVLPRLAASVLQIHCGCLKKDCRNILKHCGSSNSFWLPKWGKKPQKCTRMNKNIFSGSAWRALQVLFALFSNMVRLPIQLLRCGHRRQFGTVRCLSSRCAYVKRGVDFCMTVENKEKSQTLGIWLFEKWEYSGTLRGKIQASPSYLGSYLGPWRWQSSVLWANFVRFLRNYRV